MFPHSLCPCFILIIYCFVKITDETLEEWFETTDSTAGEVASVLTTRSSKHCSARQALSFYVHFWETKHLFFRIANFRWVWEIFIWVTSFYIALFIMDVHYKTLLSISFFNPYTLFYIQSCLLDNECKAFQFSNQEKENCALIHEATQSSNSLVSDEQNQVYKKGWLKNVKTVQWD